MTDRIRIRSVEREFDPKRYAFLVIALAKELAGQEPEAPQSEPNPSRRHEGESDDR